MRSSAAPQQGGCLRISQVWSFRQTVGQDRHACNGRIDRGHFVSWPLVEDPRTTSQNTQSALPSEQPSALRGAFAPLLSSMSFLRPVTGILISGEHHAQSRWSEQIPITHRKSTDLAMFPRAFTEDYARVQPHPINDCSTDETFQ